MTDYILVLNAGSATLKFKLFQMRPANKKVIEGNFERIGMPNPFLLINKKKRQYTRVNKHETALGIILRELKDRKKAIKLIGHRVVHGGEKFQQPIVVSKKVWQQIARYNELAPLHNPVNLTVIKACYKLLPRIKNVAVFDTAFYSSLQPENFLYALPYNLYKRYGVRRYGFHGISHKYVSDQAAKALSKPLRKLNLVTIHLGNGCSITALRKGQPITTSMGFTPLEGLVMGTRSGSIDPALVLYIQKKMKLSRDQVDTMLNRQSGLLGVSGFSSDMREILKAAGYRVIHYRGRKKFSQVQKKRARLALLVFINRLQAYLTSYIGLLGRVDAVVFTGGMGERSKTIRRLAFFGLKLAKKQKILTIPTDEELEISRQIKNVV